LTTTNKIEILGGKAIIKQNKFGVWQFRMYVKQAPRYVEKSLRTKEQAIAEEEKEALKAHKKDAIAEVKKLILQYNLTKGDIRGKALKQLDM